MKELFERLTETEKMRLGIIAAAVVLSFLALVFVSLGEWKGYGRSEKTLLQEKADFAKARTSLEAARAEWKRWGEARNDIKDIQENYFYRGTETIKDLRLDLERIFGEAGFRVSQIGYQYADLEKGKAKKMVAGFLFRGSYISFKRFLNIVERFPKFLVIERIDFLNTGSETGSLELKIELASYYET